MGRNRMIRAGIATDGDLVKCSAFARLLYLLALTEADDNGILEDDAMQLKIRLLPADDVDITELRGELVNCKLWIPYSAGDKTYIFIRGFPKNQKLQRPQAHYPLPEESLVKPYGYIIAEITWQKKEKDSVKNYSGLHIVPKNRPKKNKPKGKTQSGHSPDTARKEVEVEKKGKELEVESEAGELSTFKKYKGGKGLPEALENIIREVNKGIPHDAKACLALVDAESTLTYEQRDKYAARLLQVAQGDFKNTNEAGRYTRTIFRLDEQPPEWAIKEIDNARKKVLPEIKEQVAGNFKPPYSSNGIDKNKKIKRLFDHAKDNGVQLG